MNNTEDIYFNIDNFDVTLHKECFPHCLDFSKRLFNGHLKKRNQNNEKSMIIQHAQGKLAEWGVYKLLAHLNYQVWKAPDMTILPPGAKTFDADLQVSDHGLHIKSQTPTSRKKFGTGFMFEKKDKLPENDWIAMCITESSTKVKILGFIQVKDIVWSKPRLARLTSKRVLEPTLCDPIHIFKFPQISSK